MATLYRDSDGEGHYGARIEIVNPKTKKIEYFNGESSTLIGNMLLVGSATAGMFSSRDWWRTNVITEIISETPDEIRFNTLSGSTYTFKR